MVVYCKMTDNQLVELFQQGHQDAMEELVIRNKNRVFTYILLIVKVVLLTAF